MKTQSLDKILDETIGLKGTKERIKFDEEIEEISNDIAAKCSQMLMDQISFISGK